MMTMMTMMTTGYIDDIRAWDETLASRAATPSVGDCEASATLPNSPPVDPPEEVDTPPYSAAPSSTSSIDHDEDEDEDEDEDREDETCLLRRLRRKRTPTHPTRPNSPAPAPAPAPTPHVPPPTAPPPPPGRYDDYAHWPHPYPPTPGVHFRPAGLPASATHPVFPPMPWWHSFLDPYERINIISHGLPGLVLLSVTACLLGGQLPQLLPFSFPLLIHASLVGLAHLTSVLAHVFPDSIWFEKADHVGISIWIASTTYTGLTAVCPGGDLRTYWYTTAATGAICTIPNHKVRAALSLIAGFVQACTYLGTLLWSSRVFLAEMMLYLLGGAVYIRGRNYNDKYHAFSDHHIMHYCVTAGAFMHMVFLILAPQVPGGVCGGGH